MTSYFAKAKLEFERQWRSTCKILKGNDFQTRIIYLDRRGKGEERYFKYVKSKNLPLTCLCFLGKLLEVALPIQGKKRRKKEALDAENG